MENMSFQKPDEAPVSTSLEPGSKRAAFKKAENIGLGPNNIPVGMLPLILLVLMGLLIYQEQGGQMRWFREIIYFLTGLGLLTGVTAVFLDGRCARHRRKVRAIEDNLAGIGAAKDLTEVFALLEPFPAGKNMSRAGYGWNALVGAVDELRNKLQVAEVGKGMSQFLCSYDAQRLLGLLDSLPDGIVLTDSMGNIVLANRACEGMLGRRLSEFINCSVRELFSDPQAKNALAEILDGKSRQADSYFEVVITPLAKEAVRREAKDPQRPAPGGLALESKQGGQDNKTILWVGCHGQRETGQNGGLQIIMRDITQQKVRQAGQETFIAHVSHELRSPLTNIRAYAETLLSDMVLDAQAQKEAFNVINEETSRLIRLVNDVLDISSMETGSMALEKDEVILDRLIRQCVNDVKGIAGSKKITLQTNYHPKLPNLYADREKLAVVINNILSNAIKYTPPGGTVFIETNIDERFVYLKVADTGYGIGAEDIDRIFDKFYRVEREETAEVEGTGPGLAISKEIVTRHGGTISVASELNKGTEMIVKLPLTAAGPVLGPAAHKADG